MEKITIKSKDGGYTGYFKEMPYVITEGETKEELSKNLDEVLEVFADYYNENWMNHT